MLTRTRAKFGTQVYETMWGPNEFTVTGTLKDWDVTDRLGEIEVPTLVTSGRYDECTPALVEPLHRRDRRFRVGAVRGELAYLAPGGAGALPRGHRRLPRRRRARWRHVSVGLTSLIEDGVLDGRGGRAATASSVGAAESAP